MFNPSEKDWTQPEGHTTEERPLIIQYTEFLHKYRNPEHPEVKAFKEKHKDDAVFLRRAETLDMVWRLKQA